MKKQTNGTAKLTFWFIIGLFGSISQIKSDETLPLTLSITARTAGSTNSEPLAFTLTWPSQFGTTYKVLTRPHVEAGAWKPFTNMLGNGGTEELTVTASSGTLFLRILARQNPLWGKTLYVDPNSNARKASTSWLVRDPSQSALLEKIAGEPQAFWFNGRESPTAYDAAKAIQDASSRAGAAPLMSLYNIPNRDCLGYSMGGAADGGAYTNWVKEIVRGIGSGEAVVVIEPDGLAHTECLSALQLRNRFECIYFANHWLKTQSKALTYLDAGHSKWLSVDEAVTRLKKAGIVEADGFALNVSNFETDADTIAYGVAISKKLDDKHFVIDTSRNGRGPGTTWCDPDGRALGMRPTADTGHPLIDAFLWIKRPGELDGCLGPAGTFSIEYAVGLSERAAY